MHASLGQKRRELSHDNIRHILKWYGDFKENGHVKIFDKEEFLYREYTVMQLCNVVAGLLKETIEKASVPF